MRVEPAVSRAKFDAEIRHLDEQVAPLRRWGCWVQRARYPEVDVVFVPRTPLRISFSVPVSGGLIGQAKHAVAHAREAELSVLAARAFGVRVLMDDYDQRAPSVTFRDPWTWELLSFDEMLRAILVDEKGNTRPVLVEAHPVTKQPFLCLRGTREYHEHPQHSGDDWVLLRGGFGLFSLLSTVWRTCVENARPHLLLNPPAQVQVQWEPVASRRMR
ncbi:putative metal-binding protein [Hyalangium rubrum]|uniref:Metal-binding protein n=1 Tax=Hyalangium rubrum TaxID=3103134 RepID=A0ABU5H8T1_9BACT|nr:putative metal-binding protein [Hyalangium sp. s54d21]MDY7229894.1 putative metal-binding protein [Hyalangium sp. s54d21]